MGATIADFNGDGLFDWYVTSIYTPASYLQGIPGDGNMLYMSQGNHVYTESSTLAGVNDGGWGWGTVAVDFNHDGLIDIFETNGWLQENGPAGPEWVNERSYVYQNLGGNNFADVALACGVRHNGQGRGLANLDYDNDGDQDVVIFSYNEPLRVYRNDLVGPDSNWLRVFLDTSRNLLLAPNGFGAKVLVTAGGDQNLGGNNFADVALACGVRHNGQGRGLANLDYDNDGDQDVVIFSYNEPLRVYRNDLVGPDSNWLRVFLDTSRNLLLAPNGFGAKVLVTAGGETQVRSIDGGSNYLVQSELSAHFGLGAACEIDEVRVQWSDGSQTILSNVAVNQTLTIQSVTSGDLNGDGTIDGDDLSTLLRSWGACPGPPDPCPGDVNGDGSVSVPDLLTLLANWG